MGCDGGVTLTATGHESSVRTNEIRCNLGPYGADVARIDAGNSILPVFQREVLERAQGEDCQNMDKVALMHSSVESSRTTKPTLRENQPSK